MEQCYNSIQPKHCVQIINLKTVGRSWKMTCSKLSLFEGEVSSSTVKMICPENEDDVSNETKCDNYFDGIALEKEADHHEDSDDE